MHRPQQYSVHRFRTAVLAVMMFPLLSSISADSGLLAVTCCHSIFYIVALLFSPLLLYCLRLLPDFSVYVCVLLSCFGAFALLLSQVSSLAAQNQNLVCDLRLDLLPLL